MAGLAAVCSYFNPCGYQSRRRNYDAFRIRVEHSGVSLLTVELVLEADGESELGAYGNVLCVRGGDVMWQKERLLQIGIDHLLADGHGAVAWLDTDIVFDDNRWHENVLRALEQYDCVQSFDTLVSHYPEGQIVRPATARDQRSWANGGSWAATRAFWQRVKLYQHCILGGADTVMATLYLQIGNPCLSGFAWPEENIVMQQVNDAMRNHIIDWATRSWTPCRVGCVSNQRAQLLAHGARRHRYYLERWQFLRDFDPYTDVRISESGAFRWCCDKPQLRQSVRDYFRDRYEDGTADN